MDKQKNLFIGTIALVVITCGGWYFMYFSELNKSLEKMSVNYNQLKNEKNNNYLDVFGFLTKLYITYMD